MNSVVLTWTSDDDKYIIIDVNIREELEAWIKKYLIADSAS